MNEEKRQMKNNNKMKIKNEMKIKNDNHYHKNLLGPSKVPSLAVFEFRFLKKNDYRSVTSINFISDIVLHMVAISTFNKDNG